MKIWLLNHVFEDQEDFTFGVYKNFESAYGVLKQATKSQGTLWNRDGLQHWSYPAEEGCYEISECFVQEHLGSQTVELLREIEKGYMGRRIEKQLPWLAKWLYPGFRKEGKVAEYLVRSRSGEA
jgi:hypothetical protein